MTSLFKSEDARVTLLRWFERFRTQLMVPTEGRTVTTRFGETHVLIGGPAGAPALVVLHGALASSAHVLVELAALMERFRVYSVDVIGQSVKSADTQISVANNDYGQWLADVLDELGLASAHVIGISWGGFVATRLAACAPQRIDRLALLVPAGVASGSMWAGFTRLAWPLWMYRLRPSAHRLERVLRHLLTTPDGDWAAYLGDAFRLYRLRMHVPVLARPEELAGFTRPTLVIGAERDLSFPADKLFARAAELFPGLAGTELIAGACHSPPTTPEFRQWLAGRLTAFFAANEVRAKRPAMSSVRST